MFKVTIKVMLMTVLLFASSIFTNVLAQVAITAPSLSVTATCQFPTPYSVLGDIVITETSNNDFATTGVVNKTLILTAPTNFQFLTPPVGISISGISTDITILSISSVTANKITINLRVAATTVLDVITISGIQVRGTNSPSGPSTLKRDAASTAVINGDVTNTPHATFTSIARDPVILVNPTPKSICEGGFTSYSVSTVLAPSSYQWQVSQGGGPFLDLLDTAAYSGVNSALLNVSSAPGYMTGNQYKCKITGADDICASNAASLTVNPPPAVVSDPTDTAVCQGLNASFSVTTLGSGLTYTWLRSTNGGFSFLPFSNTTPPYSISGNSLIITTVPFSFNGYQYHCIISDGNNCGPDVQSTTPGELTVYPKPVVLTVKDTTCSPGTLDLTLPGVTNGSTPAPPGLTFTYFTDATATTPVGIPTAVGSGTYYIVGETGLGCKDTTPVQMTVNPKPVVNTSNPAQVCFPSKVDLTLPGVAATVPGTTAGLNYTYFTNPTATTHIADSSKVAVSGTYYIVGTVPLTGCSDTTAVVVTINPKPVVSTVNQSVCAPSTVDLTAAGVRSSDIVGTTFKYYTLVGLNLVLYPTPTTATAGTYYIVGEVPITLCTDTAAVIVTVNPRPNLVTTNPPAICAPGKVDITLPADTAGSSPNLTLTYFLDAAATMAIPDPTAVDSGTYYIVGTFPVTFCADTTAILVTVNPKPTVNTANPAAVCFPLTIDLTLPAVAATVPGTTSGLTYTYFTDPAATLHTTDSTAITTSGTYYIVGKVPGSGCSDTTAVVVTINNKPTVVTNDPPPICTPSTLDLTLPAVTAGSTPLLTYTYFTDAAATIHMTDSSAVGVSGIYYIVGVVGGGCSDTTAVTVTVNPKPTVNTVAPADVCFPATVDLTLPAVAATVPGTTAGLTFFYFDNPGAILPTYATPANATAGTYYILGVVLSTGCSDTTAVSVTVNPKPDVQITDQPAVCAPSTVDITIPAVTLGSTLGLNLTYYTDAAATLLYATPTTADSGVYYIVGIVPGTGCSDTAAVLVTVNPKPVVNTSNPGVCFPALADLTLPAVAASVPGTTPGLTFTYFMADGITPIPDETAVGAGTYIIVGTTIASCSDTASVTVTINSKPVVITTDPAAECFPTGVDLTLPAVTAGSTPGLVYGQFFDAGAASIHPTPDSVTVGGTYYIVGIDLATTCSDTTAINVIVNPKPVVVINTPSPVCSPDTVNLTLPAVTAGSTPGLTLSYYTDAAATNLMLDSTNVLVSGTYYIVGVYAPTGCSDTSAVVASVDAVAVGGSVGTDAFVCNGANGDTLTLTGASSTVLKWQYSITGGTAWIDIANTTAELIYSNITTTTWYRAITTEFCADAISIEARITVDTSPLPIGGIVSANDTVCSGINSDTLFLSGHTGNIVRWEYSIDNGTTWVYINDTTASLIYTNLTTTTIYHAVLQNSICNFAISSNDTITVDPVSVAGSITGGVSGCAYANGAILTLSGYTGAVVNWQYSVDQGATWIDSANVTDTLAYSNLTDTVFYRAIVNSGVCSNDTSDAAEINIYPKPMAIFVADTVCFGAATSFVNMSTIESGAIQLNQWDFGNSSSSTLVNPTHIFAQAGAGTVSLITTSNLGCLDTATVSIFVDALPDPQIITSGALSFCCGGSVSMSGLAGLNYSWSTTATTQAIVVSNCQASGNYELTVTDPATLCKDSSTVAVVIFPSLVANAGTDNTISLGDSYTLNGQGGSIYSWLPAAGLSNPNIFNPIATPVVTTTYELTVADINGCMDQDSITITVIVDFNLTVSNLMTANGDGYNDIWIVKNIENYPGTEAIVVNREGQQVFYSSSYDNSWLGLNKNGNPLPDGTYYYFLKFRNSDKIYKGPLTILNEK
ncbi:MAG: gliding motility-associated C-terminal domain-containing protein [Bacteroidia bacterium]|nr:gliding motility-associated C-terminal domain-containing protein [Bacteroidia bacterium]